MSCLAQTFRKLSSSQCITKINISLLFWHFFSQDMSVRNFITYNIEALKISSTSLWRHWILDNPATISARWEAGPSLTDFCSSIKFMTVQSSSDWWAVPRDQDGSSGHLGPEATLLCFGFEDNNKARTLEQERNGQCYPRLIFLNCLL